MKNLTHHMLLLCVFTTSILWIGCSVASPEREGFTLVKDEKRIYNGEVQRRQKWERKTWEKTVQKEVHTGMLQLDVTTALGLPNSVFPNMNNKETWIYDKVATKASVSNSGGMFTLLLFTYSSSEPATSISEKKITAVIAFDDNKKVSSVNYYDSQF